MLSLTTSKTEVNYYTRKLNARVALRVAKRPKVDDLRNSRNTHSPLQTCKPGNNARKMEKSSNELSIENPILLNFVNLCKIFCGRFSEKTEYPF